MYTKSTKGFIALFTVMILGILAAIFTVGLASRGWSQAKEIFEIHDATQARFNALSCVSVARLALFLNENTIPGMYDTQGGQCQIETVETHTPKIIIHTNSVVHGAKISFETEIHATTFEILSIREL